MSLCGHGQQCDYVKAHQRVLTMCAAACGSVANRITSTGSQPLNIETNEQSFTVTADEIEFNGIDGTTVTTLSA